MPLGGNEFSHVLRRGRRASCGERRNRQILYIDGKRQIYFENDVSDIKAQINEDSDKRRLLGREKYDYIQ